MQERTATGSGDLVSTDTKISAAFVVLGLVSWYGAGSVTDDQLVQFGVLFGVGVIAPILINEWRN
jgi:hypothetical protein